MIGHGKINQHLQTLPGTAHADVSTARTGLYHSVAHARSIMGIALCAAIAVDATVTVTLLQATDENGSGSKSLATATFTADGKDGDSPATAGAEVATVGCNVEDLDTANGFAYVAVKVQTSTAAAGGSCLVLGDLRHGVPAE